MLLRVTPKNPDLFPTHTTQNKDIEHERQQKHAGSRKKRSFKALFAHFLEDVAPNITNARSRQTTLLWIFLYIAGCMVFVIQMKPLFTMYVNYKVDTYVSVVNRDIVPFPAVTICNRNTFKRSMISGNPKYHKLQTVDALQQKEFVAGISPRDFFKDIAGVCSYTQWRCRDGEFCIYESFKCDNIEDCMDGSDEDSDLCSFSSYKGQCLDGYVECEWTDTAKASSFLPNNHSNPLVCIPQDRLCDVYEDCVGGWDESDVVHRCSQKEIVSSTRCRMINGMKEGEIWQIGIEQPYFYSSSPRYPFKYPRNTFCNFTLNNTAYEDGDYFEITLDRDFDVENSYNCRYDAVSLYEKNDNETILKYSLCGKKRARKRTISGKMMEFVFTSDSFVEGNGFRVWAVVRSANKTDKFKSSQSTNLSTLIGDDFDYYYFDKGYHDEYYDYLWDQLLRVPDYLYDFTILSVAPDNLLPNSSDAFFFTDFNSSDFFEMEYVENNYYEDDGFEYDFFDYLDNFLTDEERDWDFGQLENDDGSIFKKYFSKISRYDWENVVKQSRTDDYSDVRQFALFEKDDVTVYGHQFEDFIMQCTFNGKACEKSDFVHITNKETGNCYVFNHVFGELSQKTVLQAGASVGLKLTLFLEADEYIGLLSPSIGAEISIGDYQSIPLPEEFSSLIQPGSLTRLSLTEQKIFRQGSPYSNCTTMWPDELVMDEVVRRDTVYSASTCAKICLQNRLIESCKCIDSFVMYGVSEYNETVCDVWDETVRRCHSDVYNLVLKDMSTYCPMCLPSCVDTTYTHTVSNARWPSEGNVAYLGKTLMKTGTNSWMRLIDATFQADGQNMEEVSEVISNLANLYETNLARVEIFFKELDFEQTKEDPTYNLFQFVADFGGNLGLWIGWSALTFFEIIELIIEALQHVFCRCK